MTTERIGLTRLAAVAGVIVVALVAAPVADASPLVTYDLPASFSEVDEIAAGPDGALWFTQSPPEQPRKQVALGRITTSGAITSYPLPRGVRPTSLAAGPGGALWFANDTPVDQARLGWIDPDGVHDLVLPGFFRAWEVLTGPDGLLWFVADSTIGRIAADGSIAKHELDGIPEHVVAGSAGDVWFWLDRRIGRMDAAGHVRMFRTPTRLEYGDMVRGADGALWFTALDCDCIGRVSSSGSVRTFRFPKPLSFAYRLAAGADGAIWFAGFGGIGRFTRTGEVTEFKLRERRGRSTVASDVAVGPDGAIWFTAQELSDADKSLAGEVGRIGITSETAPELLVARLADNRLSGRAGRTLRIRFTTTRRAAGWLEVYLAHGRLPISFTRIRAGARSVVVRLPRRAGAYRATLSLSIPSQDASDSALLRLSR
ncbi:MAG: virginiamycin lyase [bacterium]